MKFSKWVSLCIALCAIASLGAVAQDSSESSCYVTRGDNAYTDNALISLAEEQAMDPTGTYLVFEREYTDDTTFNQSVTVSAIEKSQDVALRVAACNCVKNDGYPGICSDGTRESIRVENKTSPVDNELGLFILDDSELASGYHVDLNSYKPALLHAESITVSAETTLDVKHSQGCESVANAYRANSLSGSDAFNGVVLYECSGNEHFAAGSTTEGAPGENSDPLNTTFYNSQCQKYPHFSNSLCGGIPVSGTQNLNEISNALVVHTYTKTVSECKSQKQGNYENGICSNHNTRNHQYDSHVKYLPQNIQLSSHYGTYFGPRVKANSLYPLRKSENWSQFDGNVVVTGARTVANTTIESSSTSSNDPSPDQFNWTTPDNRYSCESGLERIPGREGFWWEFTHCVHKKEYIDLNVRITHSGDKPICLNANEWTNDCRNISKVVFTPQSNPAPESDGNATITYSVKTEKALQIRDSEPKSKLVPIVVGDITIFIPALVKDPYETLSTSIEGVNSFDVVADQQARFTFTCSDSSLTAEAFVLEIDETEHNWILDDEGNMSDFRRAIEQCSSGSLAFNVENTELEQNSGGANRLEFSILITKQQTSSIQFIIDYGQAVTLGLSQALSKYRLYNSLSLDDEQFENLLIESIDRQSALVRKVLQPLQDVLGICIPKPAGGDVPYEFGAFGDVFGCSNALFEPLFDSFSTAEDVVARLADGNVAEIYVPSYLLGEIEGRGEPKNITGPESAVLEAYEILDQLVNNYKYNDAIVKGLAQNIREEYNFLQNPSDFSDVESTFNQVRVELELQVIRAEYFLNVLVETAKDKTEDSVEILTQLTNEFMQQANDALARD